MKKSFYWLILLVRDALEHFYFSTVSLTDQIKVMFYAFFIFIGWFLSTTDTLYFNRFDPGSFFCVLPSQSVAPLKSNIIITGNRKGQELAVRGRATCNK